MAALSAAVKPGSEESLGSGRSRSPGLSAPDGTAALLRLQHAEILQRLDAQEDLLRQLGTGSSPPLKRLKASGSRETVGSRGSVRRIASEKSERSERSEREKRELSTIEESESSTLELPHAKKLFSSYSFWDGKLRNEAMVAGSSSVRRKYGSAQHAEGILGMRGPPVMARIVASPWFDAFFGIVVVTNGLFIGMDVEMSLRMTEPRSWGMRVTQYVYALLFSAELVLRVGAGGPRIFCNEEWMWSWLDLFIVATSIWEVVVDTLQAVTDGARVAGVGGLSSVKAFRIVRLTRIVKAVRLMRIFRFIMALRTLVTSIFHTLKSLFWALILLLIIVYVFSIIFVQTVDDYIMDPTSAELSDRELLACERYFSSLPDTMLALFMTIGNGVGWEDVMAPLQAISAWWLFLFLFYVSFTYFAVLNVVTGVFCQSAIESAQNDQTTVVQSILADKEAHLEKIHDLFGKIGADDGVITYTMFEEKIGCPAVREYFESLGLDIWDAWTFFKLLDLDAGGAVEAEEFLMGCFRLRGQARAMEVAKLIQDVSWLIRNQGHFSSFVESELFDMKKDVSLLVETLASETRTRSKDI